MRKYVKALTVLFTSAVLAGALGACGNGSSASVSGQNGTSENNVTEAAESGLEGKTYTFESYTVDGEDATASITGMYKEQTFSFEAEGVCVQTIVWADSLAETMGTEPVVQNGTYEENGDKVTVTFEVEGEDSTVMEFTVDGDTLQLIEEGSTTVYKVK